MGRGGSPGPWSVSAARRRQCIDSMAADSSYTCRRGRSLVLDTLWHCCAHLHKYRAWVGSGGVRKVFLTNFECQHYHCGNWLVPSDFSISVSSCCSILIR